MQRERVADDIYVFISELYAQVTAGAVITTEGAILIDTMVFPSETAEIRDFLEERLNAPVRYVVNTHYHADHTYGTYLFPEALVVSHDLCRRILDTHGRESLRRDQAGDPHLEDVEVVLPAIVFDKGALHLHLGNKTLKMWHTPGHSPDAIVCLVEEDRALFAADTIMPVPYFIDGSYDDFVATLKSLQGQGFENVVQGHGEVILRGEVERKIQDDLNYLEALREHIEVAFRRKDPDKYLEAVTVEECGKNRILLNGAVQSLHRQNLELLYNQIKAERKSA